MQVRLKCFATLSRYSPPDSMLSLDEGATIQDAIDALGLGESDEVRLAFVNGRHAARETTLSEGDEVGLFPPIGGG